MTSSVVIGIVGQGPVRAALAHAIEAAQASFEICGEASAIAKGAELDAVVFDVGDAPEAHFPIAVALATEERTRWVPRLVVVAGGIAVSRVAPFGLAVVVPAENADELAGAVRRVVAQVRARTAVDRHAAMHLAELRAAEQDLATLQKEGDTLSHDARVLFGVIMGFAGNLRDGIAGPVLELQRTHAANIVEAAGGASALLDRYVAALRQTVRHAETDASQSPDGPSPPRRRQNDLGELVRTTVGLFEGVATARGIALAAIAPRAILSWCDAMQVKQVLVNLLANALKFTPPGGAVEVTVRPGPPASTRSGGHGRREVELIVSDSGPGIPDADRERVFERGVRLGRDSLVPGTGLGLAVVRDIAELHGGLVRVETSPRGGATFVLTLPADLRARAEDGINGTPQAPRVAPRHRERTE